MKKIDMHTHVTNRKVKGVLPQSCTVDALAAEMKKHDIEKSVVLASYFPHKTSGISNFRLFHWIRDRPEFYLFGSLDFKHYFFQGMNELTELAEMNRLDGIKIYTGYQEIDVKGDKMKQVVNLANKYRVPMAFHCGYSHSAMREYNKPAITDMFSPKDLEFLANQNPETKFLACHMGKPFFDDLIEAVNKNKNIYTDMSGLLSSKYERDEVPKAVKAVKKFVKECGPDKLMFGTDFPVQTHEDSVHIVERGTRRFCDLYRHKIYYNNAWRFMLK